MNCAFCRDTPSPGYQCSRCGTYTPVGAPTNKGAHGNAEDRSLISLALQGLADLATRKAVRAKQRATRDRLYAEQMSRHIEHPQSRGTHRRMLSKP